MAVVSDKQGRDPQVDDEGRRPSVPPGSSTDEQQALAAIDRLARRYLGQPVAGEEIARFVDRLDRALGTCLRSFIAIQRGQQQFRAAVGLRGKPAGPSHQGGLSTSGEGLAQALDSPQALAEALLGPDSERAVQSLEQGFKGLLLAQMGLVSGLLAGLSDLLGEVGPNAVEQQTPDPHSPAVLWKTYQQIHQRLGRDPRAVLERVFGPHFARALAAVFGHTN